MAAEIENLMKARLKLDMLAGLIHEFTLLIRSLQENYKAEAVPDPVQDQIGYLQDLLTKSSKECHDVNRDDADTLQQKFPSMAKRFLVVVREMEGILEQLTLDQTLSENVCAAARRALASFSSFAPDFQMLEKWADIGE